MSLKRKLMLQSLSPLALLTIIRNFSFKLPKGKIITQNELLNAFITENRILIIVMVVCFIWLIAAIASFFSFSVFRWTDKISGYEIHHIVEKEDASLNFFMTMIIPLLIDDVYTIQGALTFAIIVILMCALLERTNLFYANPVLALLGYRVYSFSFKSNKENGEDTCIGVVKGRLKNACSSVEFKPIMGNVFYVKEMTK